MTTDSFNKSSSNIGRLRVVSVGQTKHKCRLPSKLNEWRLKLGHGAVIECKKCSQQWRLDTAYNSKSCRWGKV